MNPTEKMQEDITELKEGQAKILTASLVERIRRWVDTEIQKTL
jgi:hypothetical protein